MVKGPAVIIVVRHGTRFDAASRDWHLTSPEPYNPPLTYGGWNQAKALGARIAGLLRLREHGLLDSNDLKEQLAGYAMDGQSVAVTSTGAGAERKRKRKHRVVMHTSPYLRCLQTSIGISAGIASTKRPSRKRSTAAQLADLSLSADPMNIAVHDYASNPLDDKPDQVPERPLLRVDALLGEWQNPEYYEGMVPPPASATMVLGAKAELLRRGEPVETQSSMAINRGNFPGGWSSSLARSSTLAARAPPYQLAAGSLPVDVSSRDGNRSRSSSISSVESSASRSSRKRSGTKRRRAAAYVGPALRYAVAPGDMIPQGFVAHARDACVDVDFQWDSMRAPQEWGDGGELGEEWGAMHKRIRNGFQKMIKWYRAHRVDSSLDEQPLAYPEDEASPPPDDADADEEEVVLVLVTHGAGCNALIGALTNQPVLLDVGMASLTMAVRKEAAARPSMADRSHTVHGEIQLSRRRRSSVDFGLSREYEMKLIASTEHLRAAADPSRASRANPRPYDGGATTTASSGTHSDSAPTPAEIALFGIGGSARRTNASLGSAVRRNHTTSNASRPASRRYASPSPERPRTSRAGTAGTTGASAGGGLWSGSSGSRTPATMTTTTTQATTPATLPETLSEMSDSPVEGVFDLGDAALPPIAESGARQQQQQAERVRFGVDALGGVTPGGEENTPAPLPVAPVVGRPMAQGLWGSSGGGVGAGAGGLGRGMPQRRWTVDQRG